MDYICISKPRGVFTPEVLSTQIEWAKKILEKPGDFVPGGKVIASYAAHNKTLLVFIWDAPSIEALCPMLVQLDLGGYDTDVMPAETVAAHMETLEKALKAMKQ